MQHTTASIAAVLLIACSGCAEPTPSAARPSNATQPDAAESSAATPNVHADPTSPANTGTPATAAAASGPTAAGTTTVNPPESAAADSTPPAQPATEQVLAEPGVGRKGRSLDQFQNDPVQKIISTPAREYFQIRERVVFTIQIPQAMSLFEAEHGYAPRSHEEFMREIVEANQIQLPELQPGQRYIYNAETKELMVERPVVAQ